MRLTVAGMAEPAHRTGPQCRLSVHRPSHHSSTTSTAALNALVAGVHRRQEHQRRLPLAVRRLPRLAAAAIRAHRPVDLLAANLAQLDWAAPKGRTAKTTDRLLTVMVVDADWRSGRRSSPGKNDAAVAIGRSPESVRRHSRLLEAAGCARLTDFGSHLTTGEHDESGVCRCHGADDGRTLAEGERWCHWRTRNEWTVVMPVGITEEILAEYRPYALQLLRALAGAAAAEPVVVADADAGIVWPLDMADLDADAPPAEDEPAPIAEGQDHEPGVPVDWWMQLPEPPAETPVPVAPVDKTPSSQRFLAPSTGGGPMLLASAECNYSYIRLSPKKSKSDAASRRQQLQEIPRTRDKSNPRIPGRPANPAGLTLARELRARARNPRIDSALPWLGRGRDAAALAAAAAKRAEAGWTARDIELEIRAVEEARRDRIPNYVPPKFPRQPVRYFAQALAEGTSPLETPPSAAAALTVSAERADDRRRRSKEAAEAAAAQAVTASARGGAGHQAARGVAAAVKTAKRGHHDPVAAEAARRARSSTTAPGPSPAAPITAPPAEPECSACHQPEPDVRPRRVPGRTSEAPLCGMCAGFLAQNHY